MSNINPTLMIPWFKPNPKAPKALEPAVWRTLHAAAAGPEDAGAGYGSPLVILK